MERMSAKQRAKFAERGIAHPVSTFLPSPPSKSTQRRADTGPDRATVDLIIERDASSCVVCAIGIDTSTGRSVLWSIQHRKHRSQGGDNRPSNLALMCGHGTAGCHGNVEGAPATAQKAGWAVPSTDEPGRVPMAHAMYGWVLLDDRGGLAPTDERPEVA